MKYFFNFKLYLEGLKKIRLVGIITAIVVIVANAIPPIASLIEGSRVVIAEDSNVGIASTVKTASDFAIPMILVLFLTPFFFLSMYSFLNKRNESDFYHAIPYKRSCVLFSFLSAIYTWIWGIILISTVLTGILWFICPYTTFAFSVMPLIFGVYAATAFYIGSFILLAMTLTGTTTSNISVSAILLFLLRIIGIILVEALEELVPLFDITYSPFRFLSMRYWLPSAIISSFYDSSVFQNAALWIYSVIVLLVLYALATYCYCHRKSESAGKSAPGKVLQHVYRCAFTLPFALFTTLSIFLQGDLSVFVILLLLTLVVYFLYELITTKSIRSMLRATPYLLILVACSLLFTGGCYLTRSTVLEGKYQSDDISAIRLYQYSSIYDLFADEVTTYEASAVSEIKIPDREAAQIVSQALVQTIHSIEEDNYWYTDSISQYVEITLNSGRKIGRKIDFSDSDYNELVKIIQASEEYQNAYISLPERKEIQSFSIHYCSSATDAELSQLWNIFSEEYAALNTEEKVAFKNQNLNSSGSSQNSYSYDITLIGSNGTKSYQSQYSIPESFTKTIAYYNTLLENAQNALLEKIDAFLNGAYDQDLLSDDDSYFYLNLGIDFQSGTYFDGFSLNLENYYGSYIYEDANALSEQKELLRKILPYLTATPDNQHYSTVSFFINRGTSYKRTYVLFGFRELSEEEAADLYGFIHATNKDDQEEVKKFLTAFTEGDMDAYLSTYINITAYMESTHELIEFSNDWDTAANIAYIAKSKQEFAALLPHLSTEITNVNQTCCVSIEYYDSYNENYIYKTATFGWDGSLEDPTASEA